jgi:uncharacterized protein YdeI (YjbR/CyaY-like superfamily)
VVAKKTTLSAKPKSFHAYLERMPGNLGWTIARVPFDVAKVFGKRGQLRVNIEIGGQTFTTSLFPTGRGTHFLLVNKKMQTAGRVSVGQEAGFKISPVTREPKIASAPEWAAILKKEKSLAKWHEKNLSDSQKREISKWIGIAKTADSRRKRADEVAERLLRTMEAEIELPPLIRTALANDRRAKEHWEKMTDIQRRNHLMGIFYYKTPEAVQRRLRKALGQNDRDDALEY